MSIASEITRINNNIAASYTAVNNKGGTLPATQNSANLATAIASIPSGGGGNIYTEKLPNYTGVGSVKIFPEYVASNFSYTNYITGPSFDTTNDFEIYAKAKRTGNYSSYQFIFSSGRHGFAICVDANNKLVAGCGNGSSWGNLISTNFTMQQNTLYYLKLTRTGSSMEFYTSTDGENWTSRGTATNSSTSTKPIYIGVEDNGGSSMTSVFYGEVYLDGCYIKNGSTVVWSAITTRVGGEMPMIEREVDSGVFQMPSSKYGLSLPTGSTSLGDYALAYAYCGCSGLTGTVDLSTITTLGVSSLTYAFRDCTGITSVDLSGLTSITTTSALSYAFSRCTSLTSVNISSLTTANAASCCLSAFRGSGLTTISFTSLTTINNMRVLQYALAENTALTSVYFPALTTSSFGSYTNQFNSMLSGVTGCTVHFPSAIQSTIGSWADVTAGFGGTNTTVLFDL